MAAARFLDTMSQILGMIGDVSDAISAYKQVTVTDDFRPLGLPEEDCPEIRIRIPPRQRPRRETPWFLLKGICTVTRWLALFGNEHWTKCSLNKGWRRYLPGDVGLRTRISDCVHR